MQLFYAPSLNSGTLEFTFGKEESRHLVKVMRRGTGDQVLLTNGRGVLFEAQITLADAKNCTVRITNETQKAKKSFTIHVAVAPTKMNERFEWFLEKATEIGIDIITPIHCERSERKTIRHDRFEKITQAAMKQSLQLFLPELRPLTPFLDVVAQTQNAQKFIAHCDEGDKASLMQHIRPQENIIVLIGPEGDFTPKEIEVAQQHGFQAVSLGDNRLRTETAAIMACAIANLKNA